MSEVPYFEDTTRKAASRGEAIFGDKHANLTSGLTPTGEAQLTSIAEIQNSMTPSQMGRTATELAIRDRALHDDLPQDQIDKMVTYAKK